MTHTPPRRGRSRAPRAFAFLTLSLALAAVVALQGAARAQVFQPPVRFDMKPAGTEPAPGAVLVDAATLYGTVADYGFSAQPLAAVVGDHPADDVIDPADDDRPLLRGCVRLAGGTEFRCKIAPNTKVRLRVLLGSVPFYYQAGTTHYVAEPTVQVGISLAVSKGAALAKVADAIDLRTAYVKGDLNTGIGSWRKVWCTAKSDSQGLLRVRFDTSGGGYVPVSAIEVRPFVPLPITYKRIGATWLQPASGVSVPGLSEFHAHDFAGARAKFLGIPDPLVRATALLWLAGWLDGSEDGALDVLDAAQSALESPALQGNARALELRDVLADFRKAELHASLLNFAKSHALPPEGYGYFNPAVPGSVFAVLPSTASNGQRHLYLAENLYAQVAGTSLQPVIAWNANANADADFELSPLGFRAIDRIARIHFANNTKHAYLDGSSVLTGMLAGINGFETVWNAYASGGFRTQEFQGDATVGMCAWMAQAANHQHDKNGGLVTYWNGADVPASWLDPVKAWWKDGVTAPAPPPGTPPWADAQRRYLTAYRAAVEWWVHEHFENGEFGGGPGDDPELVALLLAPVLGMRQPGDEDVVAALRASADFVLDGDFVTNGYYNGVPIDVEHSAEFTSYPLLTGLSLSPGDPRYLQRALDTVRLLAAPPNPATPWATTDAGGHLRFKSFFFNNLGAAPAGSVPADAMVDLPLNAKALVPAFQFLAHSRNATLEGHILSWVDGWRDESLKSSPTRPRGLLPASVRAQDLSQGFGGQWWKASANEPFYDFPANLYHHSFLQGGFFGLGHQLGGPSAYLYLTPMVELLGELLGLDAKIKAGQTPGDVNTVGSRNWALQQLLTSGLFMNDVALLLHALEAEPLLQSTDDPWTPGTQPYVTPQFLADVRALVKTKSGDYMSYLTDPHTGPNPSAGQYIRKGKTQMVDALDLGARWLKNFFPLATTMVAYTDRAYMFFGNSFGWMFGSLTGGRLGAGPPSHIVTWETPAGETKPLDVSVLVNDFAVAEGTTQDRLRVLLWSFENAPRTVDFRLWHRIRPGRYHLRVGPADPNTDYFNAPYSSTDVDFDRRGEKFSFTLQPQVFTLLELERFADLPAPAAYDIAVAQDATPVAWKNPSTLRVQARVFNTGSVPSPSGALKAHAGLIDAQGTLLPLNAAGLKEIELPLAAGAPSLAGVNGYQLASTPVAVDLPMDALIWSLLQQGLGIRFRFQQTAAGDFDPGNDSATIEVRLQDALGAP